MRHMLWVLGALMATQALAQDTGFVFHLDAGQEVPPTVSSATGGCSGKLDEAAKTFTLTCSHNVDTATNFHVHKAPAGADDEATVVEDLGDPATSPVTAVWSGLTQGNIDDLLAGALYVHFHAAGRPGGDIRGQIRERTINSFSFTMDAGQQVPSNLSLAMGVCLADLNDAATELSLNCTHDVTSPTAAHIHNAPIGENGDPVLGFGLGASPLSGVLSPLTDVFKAELAAGFFYVNVHSQDFPDDKEDPVGSPGEIRGQIVDVSIFTDGFESGNTLAWSTQVP